MTIKLDSRHFLMMLAILGCSSVPALAQDQDQDVDPPARVGRLSYIEGQTLFHDASGTTWSQALTNYPVTAGDSFWTDGSSRSEIEIGGAEVRMDNGTELDVTALDIGQTGFIVPQGSINVHLSTVPAGGGLHVMTPAGQVDLVHPGTYNINSGGANSSLPPGHAQVTALEGQIQVRSLNGVREVVQGETAFISNNPPSFDLQEGNATPFDDWSLSRENREQETQSLYYVSPHMTGYQDLDSNGEWSNDPDYGAVWYPTTVSTGWAPYTDGRWVYVRPWGWTWVDNARWGFAPFHYGRWAQVGPHARWGWVPGTIVDRPVYAPALVSFIGGNGWSVSLSAGSQPALGWVPLAPHEVFRPYYRTSVDYARNVNISNVDRKVVNNINTNNLHDFSHENYRNQKAATVVSADSFSRGRPVHEGAMPVPHEQISKAQPAPSVEHLQPTPEAQRGGGRPFTPPQQRTVDMGHPQQPMPPAHREMPAAMNPQQQVSQPHASVPHIAQQSHIAPTSQGWKRMPAMQQQQAPHPPEAPHPAQAPHPAPAPEPQQQHRPDDQRK